MAVRIRIATKIFILAVSLLALTVALSAFGTLQTHKLNAEQQRIADLYIPLNKVLGQVDNNGLRRRIAFEHWLSLVTAVRPDTGQKLKDVTTEYTDQDNQLHGDIDRARALIESNPSNSPDAGEIARIHGLLDEVSRDSSLVAGVQQRILEHHGTQERALADELLRFHDALQKDLEDRREEMGTRISDLISRATAAARQREKALVTITIGATSFAVLFGLVFAWLTSRRMVHPVEILMSGVRSVEKGDLSIQIPVRSTDEIGVLTGSFNKLVDELRSKQHMQETFGKYIDPRIVEKVILNPDAAETEGGKRVMTVSFCDLVGFTGISENLTPTAC